MTTAVFRFSKPRQLDSARDNVYRSRKKLLLFTFHKSGSKAGLLNRSVRDKFDPQLVAGGLDVLWHFVATERAKLGRV